MAKMRKNPMFLVILAGIFGAFSMVLAQNPTEETALIEMNATEEKSNFPETTSAPDVDTCSTKSPQKKDQSHSRAKKYQLQSVSRTDEDVEHTGVNTTEAGNLPSYAKRTSNPAREFQSPAVETSSSNQFLLYELKRGSVLKAIIEGDLIAYPESTAPVSAIVTAPTRYKRAKLLGRASLDTSTKRINIEFHTMILPDGSTPFSLKGITSDRSGKLGIAGKHKTDYWNWLFAEVLVRSSGGLIEASAEKEHSIFGSEASVTPTNAAKKGVATGLNTMADRFGEKRVQTVETTEVTGPTAINVSIVE